MDKNKRSDFATNVVIHNKTIKKVNLKPTPINLLKSKNKGLHQYIQNNTKNRPQFIAKNKIVKAWNMRLDNTNSLTKRKQFTNKNKQFEENNYKTKAEVLSVKEINADHLNIIAHFFNSTNTVDMSKEDSDPDTTYNFQKIKAAPLYNSNKRLAIKGNTLKLVTQSKTITRHSRHANTTSEVNNVIELSSDDDDSTEIEANTDNIEENSSKMHMKKITPRNIASKCKVMKILKRRKALNQLKIERQTRISKRMSINSMDSNEPIEIYSDDSDLGICSKKIKVDDSVLEAKAIEAANVKGKTTDVFCVNEIKNSIVNVLENSDSIEANACQVNEKKDAIVSEEMNNCHNDNVEGILNSGEVNDLQTAGSEDLKSLHYTDGMKHFEADVKENVINSQSLIFGENTNSDFGKNIINSRATKIPINYSLYTLNSGGFYETNCAKDVTITEEKSTIECPQTNDSRNIPIPEEFESQINNETITEILSMEDNYCKDTANYNVVNNLHGNDYVKYDNLDMKAPNPIHITNSKIINNPQTKDFKEIKKAEVYFFENMTILNSRNLEESNVIDFEDFINCSKTLNPRAADFEDKTFEEIKYPLTDFKDINSEIEKNVVDLPFTETAKSVGIENSLCVDIKDNINTNKVKNVLDVNFNVMTNSEEMNNSLGIDLEDINSQEIKDLLGIDFEDIINSVEIKNRIDEEPENITTYQGNNSESINSAELNNLEENIDSIATVTLNENLKSDVLNSYEADSDGCGYHSSDFEFITEEEAVKEGLIVRPDFETSRRRKKYSKVLPKSNGTYIKKIAPCGRENSIIPEISENYPEMSAEEDDYVVPGEEEVIHLFENMPVPIRSEIHFLENKSLYTNVPVMFQYEGIGFDMRLVRDNRENEEYRDEAKETVQKIHDMYPDENANVKKYRKRRR